MHSEDQEEHKSIKIEFIEDYSEIKSDPDPFKVKHEDMEKPIAKPGMCPRNNVEEAMMGLCAELCSHDSDCPDDQKCCSNGCGHECMAPYKEKPGVCPRQKPGFGACVESCLNDGNCPNEEKCCSNGCGRKCTRPYRVKPGLCLKPNVC
ncbi:waprin-Phi1-like isoform X1 [Onychostoma macrolepis]|uniref:waprin-Phi1-like isoform X1 n=1 Tax=Onychostoma macrolepis TaxID=369639 RepID=UPI00272B6846|nr:waprin-Phi1-like isoform X1 [Onychostoma macrolepis]